MRIPRLLLILGTALLILFLMQIYAFQSLLRTLNSWHTGGDRNWIISGVILLIVLLDCSVLLRLFVRNKFTAPSFPRKLLLVPGSVWLISSVLFFIFALLKDLALWIRAFVIQNPASIENGTFAQTAGAVSIGVPLILTGYGALKTARDYKVERVEIQFANLPKSLDGFQIAHISDIHSGIFMHEREMRSILELMNTLNPQIAAMTGDFVDSRVSEIEPVARVFSQIKTDYGTYACMGNHDLFDDYAKLSAAMRQSGILLLDNEHRTLKINGDSLNVLGVGDASRRYSYAFIESALAGTDPDSFKVLLAHRPSFFAKSVAKEIDLQLSGHTHGGQVGLDIGPLHLSPVYLFEKYVRGLYASGKSKLYVNPGVGMVFAPMRLSVRPEITLITLRQEK